MYEGFEEELYGFKRVDKRKNSVRYQRKFKGQKLEVHLAKNWGRYVLNVWKDKQSEYRMILFKKELGILACIKYMKKWEEKNKLRSEIGV